jgi:signal peptidase II
LGVGDNCRFRGLSMKSLLMRCCVVLLLVAGTVGCDSMTKHLAAERLAGLPAQSFLADTVRLSYAVNAGGFLSVGEALPGWARTALFTFATGTFLVLLVVAGWRSGWQQWRAPALSLFVAGGFSNWVDRLDDGKVVDFLNVGIGSVRTGIFNVADVAIMLGVALLLLVESKAIRSSGS